MKLPFEVDLSGKVCVITGAAGVLCSEFARAVSMCGAKVALLDLNQVAAEKVASEINELGGRAKAYKADVLNREQIESVYKDVVSDLGLCNILINGAGGNNPLATTTKEYYTEGDILNEDITQFFNLDQEGFDFVFSLNFMGTLIPCQVFMQDMVSQPGGVVLNISSMNSFLPLTKIPAYSGAKAAISNFTKWLSVHFAKSGIRINAMAPRFFSTKQNKDLLYNSDGSPTQRTEKIINGTPMGRFGEEKELIGTLLFLLSNEASGFVTGTVIPVDGGFSSYSGV